MDHRYYGLDVCKMTHVVPFTNRKHPASSINHGNVTHLAYPTQNADKVIKRLKSIHRYNVHSRRSDLSSRIVYLSVPT